MDWIENLPTVSSVDLKHLVEVERKLPAQPQTKEPLPANTISEAEKSKSWMIWLAMIVILVALVVQKALQ